MADMLAVCSFTVTHLGSLPSPLLHALILNIKRLVRTGATELNWAELELLCPCRYRAYRPRVGCMSGGGLL